MTPPPLPDMARPLFAGAIRMIAGQMRSIEEQVSDPAARWEILRQALAELARRADKEGGE